MSLPRSGVKEAREEVFSGQRGTSRMGDTEKERKGEKKGEEKTRPAATWRYANAIVVNRHRYGLCPAGEEPFFPFSSSPSSFSRLLLACLTRHFFSLRSFLTANSIRTRKKMTSVRQTPGRHCAGTHCRSVMFLTLELPEGLVSLVSKFFEKLHNC